MHGEFPDGSQEHNANTKQMKSELCNSTKMKDVQRYNESKGSEEHLKGNNKKRYLVART